MKSISLINISFSYPGADNLFTDLSVVFRTDQNVAIIGDNGAGKSTLLKIILGEVVPDTGRIVREATVAMLSQMQPHGDKSGGQRQMTELAHTFESRADILLLDEPTNNLAIKSVGVLEDALRQYGGAILLVSHDAEFVHNVAKNWTTVSL